MITESYDHRNPPFIRRLPDGVKALMNHDYPFVDAPPIQIRRRGRGRSFYMALIMTPSNEN